MCFVVATQPTLALPAVLTSLEEMWRVQHQQHRVLSLLFFYWSDHHHYHSWIETTVSSRENFQLADLNWRSSSINLTNIKITALNNYYCSVVRSYSERVHLKLPAQEESFYLVCPQSWLCVLLPDKHDKIQLRNITLSCTVGLSWWGGVTF